MDKRNIWFWLFLLVAFSLSAQVEVFMEAITPRGLLLNETTLYYIETTEDRIVKVDINDPDPTPEIVISGLVTPLDLVLKDDYIYVSNRLEDRITRFNINDPNPELEEVVSGINEPHGMAFRGNELFIALYAENKVVKVDITDSPIVVSDVVTDISLPWSLAIRDDDLYISDPIGFYDTWYVDLSEPILNPVIISPATYGVADLVLDGTYLYSGSAPSGTFFHSSMIRIDLSTSPPTTQDIYSNIIPYSQLLHEGIMYVADFFNDTIYKVTLDELPITPIDFHYIENSNIRGMTIKENELYFVKDSEIAKVDLTAGVPVEEVVISNLTDGNAVAIRENEIYYSRANGINRKNLDDPGTVGTSFKSVQTPYGLAFKDNYLYISDLSNGRIKKVDVTLADPPLINIVEGLESPWGLSFHGDDLYIAEFSGNRISKIDVSQTAPVVEEVLSGVLDPVAVEVREDILYFNKYNNNKTFAINLSQSNPVIEEYISETRMAYDYAFYEDALFISEMNSAKITMYDPTPLSTSDTSGQQIWGIVYPNPTTDYIQISGVREPQEYTITSMLGIRVVESRMNPDEKISIKGLAKGIYFLRLENKRVFKFVIK
ncbi:T9SS type A sorting domain-containing protein [Luteirhabdus pelagi]|uniref:T9SS type A sorting domain-containing protein n=1 Tax=Luteirhabdus pelagi TaxID=2792783 RepID=UPI0019396EDF|nr:T9SS type A sorting domain-containing protein [Luteirhabdus pelagi]